MRHTVDAIDINHVLQGIQSELPALQAVQQVNVQVVQPRT